MRFETAAIGLFALTFRPATAPKMRLRILAPAEAVKRKSAGHGNRGAGEGGLPNDRTPFEEPKGPIDPKGVEAAGQVVQHYGALIEQGRWPNAEALGRCRCGASNSIAAGQILPTCIWKSASPAKAKAPRARST